MKKNIVLIVFFILFTSFLVAADNSQPVKYNELEEFAIFNTNNGKIYDYFLLPRNQSCLYNAGNADSVRIYTRLLSDKKGEIEYQYKLNINDELTKIINETNTISEVSRGINGEPVFSYNKYICYFTDSSNYVELNNTSGYDMLIKLRTHETDSSNKNYEFVSFPIKKYENKLTLEIGKSDYTYYSANSNSIEFTLMAPFKLKIISRVIFDKETIAEKERYRFQVFDNGEILSEFKELSYKSSDALIKNKENMIPSTGDINILSFEKGIHKIKIKNPDINRNLIFSIYIKK